MESFRAAFRDELDVGTVVGVTAVLLAFYAFAEFSTLAVVGAPAVLVGIAALNACRTSRGYPDAVTGVVIGASGGLVLGYLAVTTESWLLGAFAAAASWVCLDSLYDFRHGIDRSATPEEDLSEDEYYLASAHGWAVVSELREADRPLSRSELKGRTGLPDEDFERPRNRRRLGTDRTRRNRLRPRRIRDGGRGGGPVRRPGHRCPSTPSVPAVSSRGCAVGYRSDHRVRTRQQRPRSGGCARTEAVPLRESGKHSTRERPTVAA